MRSVVVIGLASLLAITTGCQEQKKENERLLSERNTLQSQYETEKASNAANQAKVSELDKQLTATRTELESTKSDLAAAKAEGTEKVKAAEAAGNKDVADAKAAMDKAAQKSAAELNEAKAKLAAATAELSKTQDASTAQGATLSAEIATLKKKVADLTVENEGLKAAAKEAPASTAPAK